MPDQDLNKTFIVMTTTKGGISVKAYKFQVSESGKVIHFYDQSGRPIALFPTDQVVGVIEKDFALTKGSSDAQSD